MAVEIKVENITNPPEKMRLMFEAVSDLVRENQNLDKLKVQDITARAGIGKGTAYEYFSSKEEIIANALMYEYSNKIQSLVGAVFAKDDFRSRIYQVMDWIDENQEYHQIFTHFMKALALPCEETSGMGERAMQLGVATACDDAAKSAPPEIATQAAPPEIATQAAPPEIATQAFAYIRQMTTKLMEEGFQEGIFTEMNETKRVMAVLTGMCEYGITVMSPLAKMRGAMTVEELRAFVYESIVKTLN